MELLNSRKLQKQYKILCHCRYDSDLNRKIWKSNTTYKCDNKYADIEDEKWHENYKTDKFKVGDPKTYKFRGWESLHC